MCAVRGHFGLVDRCVRPWCLVYGLGGHWRLFGGAQTRCFLCGMSMATCCLFSDVRARRILCVVSVVN